MVSYQVFLILLGTTIGHVISTGPLPIIIVPGWGVSKLEAKISDGSSCDTGGEWVPVWVNHDIPVDCINKAFMLQYEDSTSSYNNLTGVEVRVLGQLGDCDTVEFTDDNRTIGQFKFNPFIDYLVKEKGYVRGETIQAASYDWRLAPDSLAKTGYYRSLKTLVEETYTTNNEKVSIVAHSFGGPVALYFFNNIVTQDWKDKYINVFVPLSGAFGGIPMMLLNYISTNLPQVLGFLDKSFVTMQSAALLLPNPLAWEDKVVLTIGNSTYTANNYQKLFIDVLDRETDYNKIKQVLAMFAVHSSPNVPTHCFYGVGLPTVETLNYRSGLPLELQSVTNGDGDGVIPTLSMEICEMWSSQKETFKVRKFENINHMEIAMNTIVLDAMVEAVLNPNMEDDGFCEDDKCTQ